MFAKKDLVLAQEYFGFLLLNMFDLFLTGWIFKHEGEEANGVALWVLHNFGLSGFALFKFIMVILLIVICEVIALVNIQRARAVILGGCALYVVVVVYECALIFKYIDTPVLEHQNETGTSSMRQDRRPPAPGSLRFVA